MSNIRKQFRALVVYLILGGSLLLKSSATADETGVERPWITAPALKPGNLIAFVAASGPVDEFQVKTYAAKLRREGYRVLVPDGLVTRSTGYLAGTDDQRVNELNAMIRNPEVRAIFPVRGGYGLTRILDRIDYGALRADPKVVTGYSDVTALHLATAKHAKVISFHGPMPMSDLWKGDQPDFAFADRSFRRTLFADQYPPDQSGFVVSTPQGLAPEILVPGIAKGRLMGGNLTLICSTLGTPYSIEPRDAILFIEDVHESPYRVDRSLSQLKLAGVFDQIAGLVIGDFSSDNANDYKEFSRIFREYFSQLHIPVISRFPIGHVANNATLPIGGLAELDANRGELRLVENPVQLNEVP